MEDIVGIILVYLSGIVYSLMLFDKNRGIEDDLPKKAILSIFSWFTVLGIKIFDFYKKLNK